MIVFHEEAKRMTAGLSEFCSPEALGKIVGLSNDSVVRWLKKRGVHVPRTPGNHRRIPRAIQIDFVAESLRRDWA